MVSWCFGVFFFYILSPDWESWRWRWMGYFGLSWRSPESVFSPIRPISVDREWGSAQGAWHDQRMTGELEEESQPKQRLLLKFPRAGFHTGWQRGRDMDSTPQPKLISTSGHIPGNKWAPIVWFTCVFYIQGILNIKSNISVYMCLLYECTVP